MSDTDAQAVAACTERDVQAVVELAEMDLQATAEMLDMDVQVRDTASNGKATDSVFWGSS